MVAEHLFYIAEHMWVTVRQFPILIKHDLCFSQRWNWIRSQGPVFSKYRIPWQEGMMSQTFSYTQLPRVEYSVE